MARSSLLGSCSTLALPLLLAVLCHASSAKPTCNLHEMVRDVAEFGKHVTNCSGNCSSDLVTDARCKCLNLSISSDECNFPGHFIKALKSLDASIYNNAHSRAVERHLRNLPKRCKGIDFCSFDVKYERILCPRSLFEELRNLTQMLRASTSA